MPRTAPWTLAVRSSLTSTLATLTVLAAILIVGGCRDGERTAAAAPSQPAAATETAFELQGSRIIGCCCGTPCPCRLDKKPMQCHGCDHTDAVHIDHGHIGGTRMDGLDWVVVGRGFGQDPKGNWVVVYLSDRATPDQQKALEAMLGADMKSWGDKAKHLAGDFKGIKRVPVTYTVSADHREYAVAIPGILDFKTRAIVNPGHVEPVVSTGIMDAFGDRFVHADSLVHTYKDPELNYKWDLTGRQSNQAEFVLDNARVAKGGIGWGCWTAHSDLGEDGKYQEQMIGHE
ncbi:MAG: DUF1326 domain-containing protein [Planctomycetes bacterium]|nr:DUF1326 domain-containing protein [Planctomycetota bacterium]